MYLIHQVDFLRLLHQWIFRARSTCGSSALDHQLNYHQWIICAWQWIRRGLYHNINMIMENNKCRYLFNTRPHRNIYFISNHQILNQKPILYRPICIWSTRWIFCACSTGGSSTLTPPVDLPRPLQQWVIRARSWIKISPVDHLSLAID